LSVVLLIDLIALLPKPPDFVGLGFFPIFVASAMLFHWFLRMRPNYWLAGTTVISVYVGAITAPLVIRHLDREPESAGPVIAAASVVLVGLYLLNFLLSRQAVRLVLGELSNDVVNSSLVIAFKSRSGDKVHITPDSINLLFWKPRTRGLSIPFDAEVFYALADVTAVTVRRQGLRLRHFPVPGLESREMSVTKGHYVEIDMSGEKFVFPAKDCQQFAWLVEQRSQALVGDERFQE